MFWRLGPLSQRPRFVQAGEEARRIPRPSRHPPRPGAGRQSRIAPPRGVLGRRGRGLASARGERRAGLALRGAKTPPARRATHAHPAPRPREAAIAVLAAASSAGSPAAETRRLRGRDQQGDAARPPGVRVAMGTAAPPPPPPHWPRRGGGRFGDAPGLRAAGRRRWGPSPSRRAACARGRGLCWGPSRPATGAPLLPSSGHNPGPKRKPLCRPTRASPRPGGGGES